MSLADVPLELDCLYEDYLPYYKPYITDEKPLGTVAVSPAEIEKVRGNYTENCSPIYIEHVELSMKASDFLLQFDRVIFHGTAFIWRGKAWIITAPPETGKTTHFMLWKKLWGNEAEILNGDKPILECRDDGIVVHPSPWNGKENMGQRISAPLGGIIVLQRAADNRIERLNKEAIVPVYTQFLYSCADKAALKKVFAIEDKILRTSPVWRLYSKGDDASAILCRNALMEAL